MLMKRGLPPQPVAAGIVAAMLACAAMAWTALRPTAPAAPTASAPASGFSSARAMADVRFLASQPRPIASTANAEARRYIVDQLRAIGLDPVVQTATAQGSWIDVKRNARVALGVVNNIVLLVPGSAPDHARRPALLMASAYDTSERSVGAASSAAPVAAMLETLRVLQAGAPRANDLLVLFADGEQVGGLGTLAFAAQHRLARRAGLVLRFDGGGSRGAPVLVAASGDDRAAIAGWARAAPNAHGSSFMQAVYRLTPGMPAIGALDQVGTARLQFANVEGSTGSGVRSRDTVDRLDPASVQATADTMLALARHFGQAPPAATPAGAAVYFNVPGIGVAHYPAESVWMLVRVAVLMLFIVCAMAICRGDAEAGDIVHGALGFALIGALIALATYAAWESFPSLHKGYNFAAYGAGMHDGWFLGAFAALAAAMFIVFQRGLRRAVGKAAAALGPLLLLAVLLPVASWKLPGASYALAWPLIGTLFAYGALYSPFAGRLRGYQRALILLAGALPALLLLPPLVLDVFTAASPENMHLPLAVLLVLFGMSVLLLTAQRRFVVRALLAAGTACLAVAASAAPYGGAPVPEPNRMVYLKDAYNWKSYWMLPDVPLDAWSRQFFPGAVRAQVQVDAFGHGSPKMWLSRAPRTALAYPDIVVLKDDMLEKGRVIEFTLQANAQAPVTDITLKGAGTEHTSVNGRALTAQHTNNWTLSLYGMGGQLLRLRMVLNSDDMTRVFIHERIPGLPPNDAGARPAGMLPLATPMTETTILSDTLLFR